LLLVAVTILVLYTAKRFQYLAVGWFWYAGTLVPVIGLIQVGSQARADRYTYIPLIGLFIIVAWGIPQLLKQWRHRKEVLIISSALILSCLFIMTRTQVGSWQNSITLFDQALKVTARNVFAYNNRGEAYYSLGNYQRAIEDFDKAIAIDPKFAQAYNNRGNAYVQLGNNKQAIDDYDKAVKFDPGYAESYFNLGNVYMSLGNQRQAIENYDKAVEFNPNDASAYLNRGAAHAILRNYRQALEDFDKAIEINPNYARAYDNRGIFTWSLATADRQLKT